MLICHVIQICVLLFFQLSLLVRYSVLCTSLVCVEVHAELFSVSVVHHFMVVAIINVPVCCFPVAEIAWLRIRTVCMATFLLVLNK